MSRCKEDKVQAGSIYLLIASIDRCIIECAYRQIYESLLELMVVNLQPNIMTKIPNIFSLSVLGATLPNPTEMSPVKVK